ncbi:hypothetical protein [Ornithinimicrobium avium]|uniref:Uncharacterized protein n=1 Tax=Ornithinimicrobium avium TaxID=2283195 RepID=A0A345NNE7_9MICO|nr:hypothetical protein [Ornithinimicrobium avium]AXH96555.1 hypothetical protein DV701_10855 [Ornithinimicrobium avium]
MTAPEGPARRVRVTASRRGAPAALRRPVASALAEQTGLGELYLQGLLRAQLRLTAAVASTITAVLLGIPLIFALVPATRQLHVGPLPLPWLVLGVLIYPTVVAAAAFYTRQTERTERRFVAFVSEAGTERR